MWMGDSVVSSGMEDASKASALLAASGKTGSVANRIVVTDVYAAYV